MTHVVTESCIKCKYTDCVDVCPVDCFREGPNMLVIDPDECIDCAVCIAECPVEAIFAEDDVPAEQKRSSRSTRSSRAWPTITERKQAARGRRRVEGREGQARSPRALSGLRRRARAFEHGPPEGDVASRLRHFIPGALPARRPGAGGRRVPEKFCQRPTRDWRSACPRRARAPGREGRIHLDPGASSLTWSASSRSCSASPRRTCARSAP